VLAAALSLLLSACATEVGTPGYTVQDGSIRSARLGKDVPYWIALPDGVTQNGPLPVVFFLHGRTNSRHMFRDLGGMGVLVRHRAAGGRPFAVVGLSGAVNGRDTYWVDGVSTRLPWATIVLTELIPQIEARHGLGQSPGNRVLAGISMGSHGAFQLAIKSRGMFDCVAGHSLVVRSFETISREFPGLFGDRTQYAQRDPLTRLTRYRHMSEVPFKHAWVDIGGADDAYFLARAGLMEAQLRRLGFAESRGDHLDVGKERPQGDHSSQYWTARLPEYVAWYDRCLAL